LFVALAACLGIASCASQGKGLPGSAPNEACRLLPGEPDDPDPVRIAFDEGVHPGDVPAPINDAERLVFRNVYEGLVDVDCTGEVRPALAVAWEAREGGRVWSFRLREGMSFSDGTPLRGGDILAAWERTSRRAELKRDAVWSWIRPESVRVGTDGELQIALTRSLGDLPAVFAHDQLVVWRSASMGGWPSGSGPYQVLVSKDGLALHPNPHHPAPGFSPFEVVFAPGADPRDLFALDVDVLLVRDGSQVDYASRLEEFTTTALPWSRIYSLISPFFPGSPGAPDAPQLIGEERRRALHRLRMELATNVVGADARVAPFLDFAGEGGSDCPVPAPSSSPDLRARRFIPALTSGELPPTLYYPEGDADAMRIAQRLVALTDREGAGAGVAEVLPALPPVGIIPVAQGKAPPKFWGLVDDGWTWGCVTPLSLSMPGPCLGEEALFTSAPWMWCHAGGCPAGGAHPDPRLDQAALTLVATRARRVCRKGLVWVSVDWEGVPRLAGVGWASPAS